MRGNASRKCKLERLLSLVKPSTIPHTAVYQNNISDVSITINPPQKGIFKNGIRPAVIGNIIGPIKNNDKYFIFLFVVSKLLFILKSIHLITLVSEAYFLIPQPIK